MKWWDRWTRKFDGWVARRRRFLKRVVERISEAAGQKVPAVVSVTVPETREPVAKKR